ncbi:MAG: PaaX domain-containing protein, C- domain protein [Acidimicrobiales bacterium]
MTGTSRNTYVDLKVQPLSARSMILSVLLGTHPPRLPLLDLLALGDLFGFRAGTVRTALSRMTNNEELTLEDGWYALGERMQARQQTQDSGRATEQVPWSGEWILATVLADRRSSSARRAFRASMLTARMGELRPDTWLRPANIPPPSPARDLVITTGPTKLSKPLKLVSRLWPLAEYDQHTTSLLRSLETTIPMLESGDHEAIPYTFRISAEVVRFLRVEPKLPHELHPGSSSVELLRRSYDEYEVVFARLLRDFLMSQRSAT